MKNGSFKLVLGSDRADVDMWRPIDPDTSGVHFEFGPGDSVGSVAQNWSVGKLELICLEVSNVSLAPIPERVEPYLFLKMIKSGAMFIEADGRMQRFGPGSIVLTDPTTGYIQHFAEQSQVVALRVPRDSLRERGFRVRLPGVLAPDMALPDVRAVGSVVCSINQQNGNTSARVRQRQGEHVLDLLNIFVDEPSTLTRARSRDATMFRAKQFIARNLSNVDLDATVIAAGVNVSLSHLHRIFKFEGHSLMRYVWHCRLELAADLLKRSVNSPIPLREIAYRCGFSSPAHFSRVFKKRYGSAPRDAVATMSLATSVAN
jgi:AraC-like DNA-binding protein